MIGNNWENEAGVPPGLKAGLIYIVYLAYHGVLSDWVYLFLSLCCVCCLLLWIVERK